MFDYSDAIAHTTILHAYNFYSEFKFARFGTATKHSGLIRSEMWPKLITHKQGTEAIPVASIPIDSTGTSNFALKKEFGMCTGVSE